ncbi:MAG: hypothetical protein JST54_27165 [Deltaproteobacteria bacterium]|nr:hypothetical protein [Deltaproteobacteria bacterium]
MDYRIQLPHEPKPRRKREVIPPEWSVTKTKRESYAEQREVFWLSKWLQEAKDGPAAKRTTVAELSQQWLDRRKKKGIPNVVVEEQRLKDHILPLLGSKKVSEIRTRHAIELIEALQAKESVRGGKLAPRTVRQIYFTFQQMVRYAVRIEILNGNPIELERGEVPKIVDKDLLWRQSAVFSAGEVEQLISDTRISAHRRVAYALEFLTGLRTGETSALRWGDYDPDKQPLGRIVAARSWDSKRKLFKPTKTEVAHEVPVHPVLAAVLARWRMGGWRERMKREPTANDLIVPTINDTPRDVRKALEDFHEDLDRLGLRRRRHYDSRRTFISVGLDSGASKDILQTITHPRPADAFDLYRTASWEARCSAVSCIKVELRQGAVIDLVTRKRRVAAGTIEAPTSASGAMKDKAP